MPEPRGRKAAPGTGIIGSLGPAARLLGIGWYFVVAVLAGVGGGWWLGQRFSSVALQILFSIAGLILGLAAALYGGYRFVRETLQEVSDEEKGRPRG